MPGRRLTLLGSAYAAALMGQRWHAMLTIPRRRTAFISRWRRTLTFQLVSHEHTRLPMSSVVAENVTQLSARADFLDEDALEEPEQLGHYKAIFVTQPNVPVLGTRGLLVWVANGGHLITVSNAMNADAFDTPSRELEAASGIAEPSRLRLELSSDSSLALAANGTLSLSMISAMVPFAAYGVRANLSVASRQIDGGSQKVLGRFADGGVALARASVGSKGGTATRFGWLPGVSYWFTGRAAASRVSLIDRACLSVFA